MALGEDTERHVALGVDNDTRVALGEEKNTHMVLGEDTRQVVSSVDKARRVELIGANTHKQRTVRHMFRCWKSKHTVSFS